MYVHVAIVNCNIGGVNFDRNRKVVLTNFRENN